MAGPGGSAFFYAFLELINKILSDIIILMVLKGLI